MIDEVKEGREGWLHYRGKKIGRISREKFICHRNASHFYIKLQSFGIAEDVLDYLLLRKVKVWVIFYHGAKEKTYVYRAPLWCVKAADKPIQEDDYEVQYHLPVDDFEKV